MNPLLLQYKHRVLTVGSPENNYCFYVSGEDDEGCGHEKVKIPGDLTEEVIVDLVKGRVRVKWGDMPQLWLDVREGEAE